MRNQHSKPIREAIAWLATVCGARHIEAEPGLTPVQSRALLDVAVQILGNPALVQALRQIGAYVQCPVEVDGHTVTWDVWRRDAASLRIQLVGTDGDIDDITD